MAVRVHQIMGMMDRLAPREWALEGDNVGLQVGRPDQVVSGIVVALDLTKSVIDYAVATGANFLITHHPVIFRPLTALRTDLPLGALIAQAVQNEIAVFSAHTNLDVCQGGVSFRLAEELGIEDPEVLAPTGHERLLKLVVYVPLEAQERVCSAIWEAGAGHIGNYSHCAFQVCGEGTFKPLPGSDPYVGRENEVTKVSEVRVETILRDADRARVVRAMLAAHPYEEVAYDLFGLEQAGEIRGLGCVGRLARPVALEEFALTVKARLGAPGVRVVGDSARVINKVAVLGGAGGKYVHKALFAGADVLVLGDLNYHDAEEARGLGMALIDAGHGPTERIVLATVAEWLEKGIDQANEKVPIEVFREREETFRFY